MTSRDKILAAVKANQPDLRPLPEVVIPVSHADLIQKYTEVASGIGAKVYEVESVSQIKSILADHFDMSKRKVTTLADFADFAETDILQLDPHALEDVELAILKAELGVAENSALWVAEQHLGQRVVPFICQHLAILVEREKILPTMHQAYEYIGERDYGYAAFIAGPSKTADIEQSLVLGAHGPRSLSVFIV
ncbi:LUD domain-containing protein [Pedobacter sp. SYSU D00535]|uniref:LutC/YkgG family protein n=1 Tax=Pedobacter sp. SYSU D00535 TaxID=2810308 RepID=UPI001A95EBBE|nr:LUD domain-containing protein [Pedobacter sp. SYSU D00535]